MQSKNGAIPPPLFYLKVDLGCCATCQNKAKKGLQKLDGVVAVKVDTKAGLVAISGHLEPHVAVKKFAEWGKTAVIWSPQKDTSNKSNHTSNSQQAKKGKDCCCHEKYSSLGSDSDSGHDEGSDHKKPSKISWQHPDIANKPVPVATTTKQRKKRCWLLGFCCGKDSGAQVKGAGPRFGGSNPSFRSNTMGPTSTGGTWFPPTPRGHVGMYGGSRPFLPPSFGNQLYRPMAYGSVAVPPRYGSHPYHQPMHHPPPPPPHGYYPPPPRPVPQFNPMIHFTRYEDNYSYW